MILQPFRPLTDFIIQGDEGSTTNWNDRDLAGISVSSAGDVNGDGFDDLIVGALGNDGGENAGEAYVIFGSGEVFGTPDDAGRQVIDLTTLDASQGFIIQGDTDGDRAFRVSSAGDVNGDGFDDLIVGAPGSDAGGDTAGEAYVVFGFGTIFGENINGRQVIDLTTLNASQGFIIQGDQGGVPGQNILGDYAGASVSAAGDVNGDGFDDLIIGAPNGDDGGTDAGEAYIVFGGAFGADATQVITTGTGADEILIGGLGDDILTGSGGADVLRSGAGDDILGISDTGFARIDGGTGSDTLRLDGSEMTLDLTQINPSIITDIERIDLAGSGSNALTLDQLSVFDLTNQRSDGTAIISVLGDPDDSVIFPDWGWLNFGPVTQDGVSFGRYVVGNAEVRVQQGIAVSAPASLNVGDIFSGIGFRLDGSGYSVSGLGDIDGDGIDDLIVGAPNDNDTAGASYVVFGGQSFGDSVDLASLDGLNGFRLDGIAIGDRSGFSVAGAGDINGDGIGDLIVGAPDADVPGRFAPGESYVVFGGQGFGDSFDLTSLDGLNGFRLEGIFSGDRSGFSVSGAGDVNGDGIDDLIVGAPMDTGAGESFVVFGGQSFAANLSLSDLNGGNGFSFYAGGVSVSGAGDINGDGIDDLVIATDSNFGVAPDGFVVFGGQTFGASLDWLSLDGSNGFSFANSNGSDFSVSGAGDINGDGIDDLLIGNRYSLDAGESYVVFGGQAFEDVIDLESLDGGNGFRLFTSAVSGLVVSEAGDINGDGFDDLIIGAYTTLDTAESYVVFGSDQFEATFDLAGLDGTSGFRVNGAGSSVSGAGDLNGDGFDDLIIGSSESGQSYVLFGGPFTGSIQRFGTSGNDTLTGTSAAETLIGNLGDDTLRGQGGADVLRGGGGNDRIEVTDSDFFKIDGGGGQDTLALTLSFDLDLTTVSNSAIELIEAIDLNDTHANTLTLNPEDVFDLSETDNIEASTVLGVPTANTLVVRGSTADTVILENVPAGHPSGQFGFWTPSSTGVMFGAETFNAYAFDPGDGRNNATLYIEQGITVTGVSSQVQSFSLANLNGSNGFIINGIDALDSSGGSVSGAGDVDGDGIDDLVIGADGQSYVVFGGQSFGTTFDLATLDGTNGFRLDGGGSSVSGIGDINGDGIDDLIVGAPGANDFSGQSYVVFGGQPFGTSIDLASLDGANGFRLDGIAAGDNSGFSVAGAGDINGDGINDIIIGAPGADFGDYNFGQSYVVFGGQSFGASFDLSNLDGSNGFYLDGLTKFDNSGSSVSGAGDFNGDGIDDLVIGASGGDGSQSDINTNFGESYVVFGGQSFGASFDLSSLDGSNGVRIDGPVSGLESGWSVSNAGDVNGDGVGDLIIGTHSSSNGLENASYVVFGGQSFGATFSLNLLDGSNGFRIDGIDSDIGAGVPVSGAGDINGDGFDDLIVGVSTADPGGDGDAGSTYLVFGGPIFDDVFDLGTLNLDSSKGLQLDGKSFGDGAGDSVSAAGDVNGDGFDDLIIGAPSADPAGNIGAGESYVLFGGNFTSNVIQFGDDRSNLLTGTIYADTLIGNLGDDTLQGGGGPDILRGGGGNDRIEIGYGSFLKIDGGGGQDTLALTLPYLSLDLTTISNTAIELIEAIDLNGANANTLTLNPEDVFDISETANTEASAALGAPTANTLVVRGGGLDTVNLTDLPPDHPNASGSWTQSLSNVAIGAETFDVFVFDDGAGQSLATVLIEQGVTVTGGGSIGTVLDGQVLGATVFVDENENDILDPGEINARTDVTGGFVLSGGGSGPIVSTGGIDIATGLALEGLLRAPKGSSVVTPLTTLVAALVDSGATPQDAENAVKAGLGLSVSIDLTNFDPVAASLAGDPDGDLVSAAGVQVQNTLVQLNEYLQGAGAPSQPTTFEAVVAELASAISTSSHSALTNSNILENIIDGSAQAAGLTLPLPNIDTTRSGAANVIAAGNAAIDQALADGAAGEALQHELAQVAIVAQAAAAPALSEAVAVGTTSAINAVKANFTTQHLDNLIQSADVGVVNGGVIGTGNLIGTSGNDALEGQADADTLTGLEGNDLLVGGPGNDIIDGGPGNDKAIYDVSVLGYDIVISAGSATVTDNDLSNGDTGQDTLIATEEAIFADAKVLLDGRNNDPFTVPDAFTTTEDDSFTFAASDLLANDREFDGDTMAITSYDTSGTTGATTFNLDGTITYDPNGRFDHLATGESANDLFFFTVEDGNGGTATGTATITVTGINEAPILAPFFQTEAAALSYEENAPATPIFGEDVLLHVGGELLINGTTEGFQGEFCEA